MADIKAKMHQIRAPPDRLAAYLFKGRASRLMGGEGKRDGVGNGREKKGWKVKEGKAERK